MRTIAALVTACLLAPAAVARAEDTRPADPPPPAKMGHEMNGFAFMPTHLMEDPFIYTAFGITLGLGAGEALGPKIQLNPPAILTDTKWYGYTGLGLGVIINVKILDWLAARADLSTDAYLGTGSGAVLTVGTSARIAGAVGVKASLPVGEQFRFSASVDARYGPVYSILIAQGLIDAINSGQIDLGEFLQQQNTITWFLGANGAWAPTPYLGFTAAAQFVAPTKTGKDSVSQNGLKLAGSAGFDALPLVHWLPLGLNTAYTITMPLGSDGVSTAQEFGVGLYYTGRKDLSLGLELDWSFATLPSQQVQESKLAWINFRYYWN